MRFLLKPLRYWRRLRKLEAFRVGVMRHLHYIVSVDSSKPPAVNQSRGGIMPPIGSRLKTPREVALQLLEQMEKSL